ncbi:conserved Plasmodium protein, unknown function [Babesia microti strain RI]|uniref:F-box domain-containing protein n=1 Tax=Babesia microti (strain RI) TaxID=1133968 RepID=A0A1R4ACT2_BABMR|nr:conserved Plasmodium protein, unknown function [Babesia microti strain RI]SJK86704.1 conserved Plasmodium protein, unknown function [Babesia microti strain RI]|eukprot:XP_021338828.1 conserved Plasmodium protein, unknown function [Babesia microti strain RI]
MGSVCSGICKPRSGGKNLQCNVFSNTELNNLHNHNSKRSSKSTLISPAKSYSKDSDISTSSSVVFRLEKNKFLPSVSNKKSIVDGWISQRNSIDSDAEPFLILDTRVALLLINYLMGQDVLNLRQICRVWRDIIDYTLDIHLEHIIAQFKCHYKGLLEPVSKFIKASPIYNRPNEPRIDLIITAKVIGGVGMINNIGYKFKYKGKTQCYGEQFHFQSLRQGSNRMLFFERDESHVYTDDIKMPVIAGVHQFCVGDFLQIPINLHNAYSTVDMPSIEVMPCRQSVCSVRQMETCHIDSMYDENWEQITQTSDKPQKLIDIMNKINSLLKDNNKLMILSADHAGYDVATIRLRLIAVESGKICEELGRYVAQGIEVFPAKAPITGILTRKGLTQDLYTTTQLRMGDIINFYLQTVGAGPEDPTCAEPS